MKTYLYAYKDMVYLFLQSDKNSTAQTLDADAKIVAEMIQLYDTDNLRVIYLGGNEVELVKDNLLLLEKCNLTTKDAIKEYITKIKNYTEETKVNSNTNTESTRMSFGKIVLTKEDIFTKLGVNNVGDVVITNVKLDNCDDIEITFATPTNNIKDKSIATSTQQVTRRLYLDIK